MAWTIYDKTGTTERCTNKSLEYNGEWLGASSVTCTFKSEVPIPFEIGDYLVYRGEKFEINYDPTTLKKAAKRTTGEAFVYDNVKFNDASDELSRCDFLDYVKEDNNIHFTSLPKFSFFCSSIQELADRIQVNLDRIYTGDKKWTVVVQSEYVNTTNINIDVQKIKVWDALGLSVSKFNAYFIIRGRTITIGTAGIPTTNIFKFGKGNGLYEIERTAEADQQIVTRVRVYGSTRNMPTRYYNKLSDSDLNNYLPNNMAVDTLMLPDFPYNTLDPYIDSDNIDALGIREATIYFDGTEDGLEEIYPSMEGMTASDLISAGIDVSIDEGDNGNLDEVAEAEQTTDDGTWDELEDGEEIPTFTITIKDIGFDINDYLSSSGTATISMKDGMCGAREFEITKCEKSGNKYVLTCNRVYDEGLKLYFPYKDYNIQAGDKFVLLDIEMPEVYIKAASQRLKTAGEKWLAANDYVRYSYSPKVDEIFMARQHDEATKNGTTSIHDTIKEGDLMLFEDEDLGIEGNVIIDKLTIKEGEDMIPKYTITLRNEKTVGSIEKLQNQIDSIMAGTAGQGSGGLNTQQIQQLLRTIGSQLFLSRTQNDKAAGLITFLAGAVFGSSGFAEGLSGFGAKIDEHGNGFMQNLTLTRGLEVPELRFNRAEIVLGDKWRSPGAGIVESVEPDYDEDGNMLRTGIVTLKLQEGELGAVAVDDICMGYFHDGYTLDNNATENSDDSKGNRLFAGFCTIYFRITEILDSNNKQFRYMLRAVSDSWKYSFHPCEGLHFVAYGNFTDESRQTSAYETRTYRRFLVGVNDWEFTKSMIAMQDGDLTNLNVFDLNMTGYSAYLNNIYMTGTIEQIGVEEPVRIEIDTQGDQFLAVGESLTLTCKVFKGWTDITDTVTQWSITRDSGDTTDDEAWAIKHQDFAGTIEISYDDLGNNAYTSISTLFTVVAQSDGTELANATIEI